MFTAFYIGSDDVEIDLIGKTVDAIQANSKILNLLWQIRQIFIDVNGK